MSAPAGCADACSAPRDAEVLAAVMLHVRALLDCFGGAAVSAVLSDLRAPPGAADPGAPAAAPDGDSEPDYDPPA